MEADTESLRTAAPQWSLAGDKQLLGVLQDIHERLVSRCQETNLRLGEMASALDEASIDLQNVNNKFMALSNSQFIESRVYDDDADVAAPEPAKEPQKPAEATTEVAAMKMSVQLLEDMHETLLIVDSDIDSDCEDDGSRMILKPKDLYEDRPLPYIIGTYAWQSKWHAGLLAEDSDTDSSVKRESWDREEYSESETEASKPAQIQQSPSSSDVSDVAPPRTQATPRCPASVAEELARRLGGELPEPTPRQDEDYIAPAPPNRKVYRPEQPATTTIFSDEPPPLEQAYQSDEDDIFAELRRKPHGGEAGRGETAQFGGGGFHEPPPVNEKSALFSEESEPELFEQPPPLPKQETPSTDIKKPIGGISLFGNKGTESIGAAILKRNRRRSSTDEDVSESTSQKQEKDIFDHLFAKSEKEQKKKIEKDVVKQVKKVDLFTDNVLDDKKVVKDKVKEVKTDKKVDLFSDNLFDDIDDIFTSNIPKVAIKSAYKNQKSLFDDDELFSEVSVVKGNGKETKDKKSIFDSDDDLFTDNGDVAKDKSKNVTTTAKTESSTKSDSKKSIFDSDDDVKVEKNVSKERGKDSVIRNESIKPDITKKSIFDSDDELFSDKTDKTPVSEKSEVPKDKTKSIFDDSDSDIFSDSAETKSKDFSDNRKVENIDIVKSETSKMGNKPVETQKAAPIPKSSLFDDDEEDIFKTESVKKEINKNVIDKTNYISEINKNSSKSVFDDKVETENINQDKKIDSFQEKDDRKLKKSLFNDDSEDELFNDIPKVVTKHVKAKSDNLLDNDDDLFKDISLAKPAQEQKLNEEIVNEIREIKNEIKDEVVTQLKDDLLLNKDGGIKTAGTHTETNKPVESSIFDDDNDDIFKDPVSKEKVIETITTDSSIFKESGDILFSNASKRPEMKDENDIFDDIPNIPKHVDITSKAAESKGTENTKNSSLETITDDIFDDLQNLPEIAESKSKSKDKEIKENIERPDNLPESKPFDKPDGFTDIFLEPPEFEKPKEPKKSKNVNALFDDDSDDEALFFKKNDPTLDEKPEFESSENRLFGIFQDEPPALEVDFVQKSSTNVKNDILDANISIFDDKIDNIPQNSDEIPQNEILTSKDQTDSNLSQNPVKVADKEEVKKSENTDSNILKTVTKNEKDKTDNAPKSIGKLKSMNFNINVNALLPGASPKKSKPKDNTEGQTKSSEDVSIKHQEVDTKTIEGTDSKMVKSISFEEKSDSKVLDNKLSKERAKIQVKRRPSTRRARKEAVRKSGIDFGDDSTDNSSSVDDQPKVSNTESVNLPKSSTTKSMDVHADNKDIIQSDNNNFTLPIEAKSEVHKNIPATADIDNNKNINTYDIDKEIFNVSNEETKEIPKEIVKDDIRSPVTTKTVYILNDEDIFSFEKPKKVLNIVDDDTPGISTLGNAYKEPENISKSDSDDDLFRNLNPKTTRKPQTMESNDNIFKSQEATDSDENLFKPNNKKEAKSIFDNDKTETDEYLFQPQTKKTNITDVKKTNQIDGTKTQIDKDLSKTQINKTIDEKPKPQIKEKGIFDLSDDEDLFSAKKSNEEVFKKEVKKIDVKASLFGNDDDEDWFGGSFKKTVDPSSTSQPSRSKETITKLSEPVFEDPLSLLGGEED